MLAAAGALVSCVVAPVAIVATTARFHFSPLRADRSRVALLTNTYAEELQPGPGAPASMGCIVQCIM